MRLWEIIRDLNDTDLYPVGTVFIPTAPFWKGMKARVKAINNHPHVLYGKSLYWEVDANGKRNQLVRLSRGAIKYDWIREDNNDR